ncbi:MAG: thiamine pyrophosphate-binding protein, partial [Pseudomonadota bacterium]
MTTDAGASAEGTTGADILGRALAEAGCTHAFGIPGGEVLALIEGLDKAGIRFILTKHENAAGFMAEGVWHAESHDAPSGSAAPGLLVATLGPGVANAINTVANAYQDRVPLLFLTGRVPAATAESYTHQVFDHRDLLRPIVKGSFEARPGTVGLVVQKALALSLDGQPGPVHLDLPIDVMEGLAANGDRVRPVPPAPRTTAPADADDAALLALSRATRPLVIAGVDAVNEGAGPAVAEFCQRHGIPLVTSYKAKGLLDEAHPLCLGAAGLSPKADGILLPLIAKADAILLAG